MRQYDLNEDVWSAAWRDTPRQAGEDVIAWLDRIVAAVRGRMVMPDQRLPYREPGSDDD